MKRIVILLFMAMVFLMPLIIAPYTVDYYNPPKELFSMGVVIFCLMLWFINGIKLRRFEIKHTNFFLFLLLFCLVTGFSILWADSSYLAFRDYTILLMFVGAFFICVNVFDDQKDMILLGELAFGAGLIAAAYAVCQYFGVDFINYKNAVFPDWRFRLYSSFGNPDFLANYLILIFPLGVAFYLLTERFLKKLILLSALVVIYSALLVTFSLGALIGLSLAFVFILFLFFVERIRLRNLIYQDKAIPNLNIYISVLAIALLLSSGLFFTANKVNPVSVLQRSKASIAWRSGLKNRIMCYRAAYGMIKHRPFLGVGAGNFKYMFPGYRGRIMAAKQQYATSFVLDKERQLHVHSDLLQAWVETGIAGFFLLFLIMIIILRNGIFLYFGLYHYKNRLFVLGLLCGIIAFLIHSFISFPFHVVPNGLLFWVFAALIFTQMPEQNKGALYLKDRPIVLSSIKISLIFLALALCIWPVRFYLSDVFLKKMINYDRRGLFNKAFAEASTSLYLNPDSNAGVYVGNYAVLIKDYPEAEQAFARVLKNNDEINYHIALAEVYYNEGLSKSSLGEYKKALALNPYSSNMRLRLTRLYAENKMYKEAEAECQILMLYNQKNDAIKKEITAILAKVFEEKFLATYNVNVPAKK